MGSQKFSPGGTSMARPSWVSSAARSPIFCTCSSSSATPDNPAPEVAWYVLITNEWRPASVSSGFSTGIATMVVQLGLAMMPFGTSSSACALTSGTTRGTSGSMRQADELSMTVAPAAATTGARVFEVAPPAENSAISRPLQSAVAASSTVICRPSKSSERPALRDDANSRMESAGKLRSASIWRITPPT